MAADPTQTRASVMTSATMPANPIQISLPRTVSFAALLFAAVVGAATCRPQPAGERAADSPYRATSTVREVMQSVDAPSAQGLWDAVGTILSTRLDRKCRRPTLN